MPIWTLSPTNMAHPYWRTSRYRQRVVVRAETAGRARGIAATEFETDPDGTTENIDALSPWLTRGLVTVERSESGKYAEEGREGIVESAGDSGTPR
jgi:hypothetical protein